MPERSDTAPRPTSQLVEAGEVLQTLTPPTLATLQILIDYDISTQSEMADIIGCARPSVSRYLQSLEDLPLSLARKQGHNYSVTESGERVFGLIESMLDRLGIDLREIEWSNETDQDDVEDRLSPLYDSRSTWPFLILDAIREESDLSGSLGSTSPVSAEKIVVDVRSRQQEMGKTVTAKQIRKILWRFDETGVVEFDGGRATLTKKGQEHARLLHQLTQVLGDSEDKHTNGRNDSPVPDEIATLFDPRAFRGGSQTENITQRTDQMDTPYNQATPTIVPVYLCPPDEPSTSADQASLPPMLPFTSLTVEDLTHYANRLDCAYDGNTRLEPYWALQTDDGLFPLGPAQLTIGYLEDE